MNEEQINLAIAEVRGWRNIRGQDDIDAVGNVMAGVWWFGKPPHGGDDTLLPDHCNDLNAMHEVEETLDDQQYTAFSDYLYDAECQRQKDTKKWRWLSATARQRAEAFLRTIGKWEEAAK